LSVRWHYQLLDVGTVPPVAIHDYPRTVLYHSTAVGAHPVHHNSPVCRIGGQTSIKDVRLGDDGRPLCDECMSIATARAS
jgi:hypothetical protein